MIIIKWYPIYLLLVYILLQFKFLCGCNTMRSLTPYIHMYKRVLGVRKGIVLQPHMNLNCNKMYISNK